MSNYFTEILNTSNKYCIKLFDLVNSGTWNILVSLDLPTYIDFFGSERVNLTFGVTAISEQIYYVYNVIMYIELILLIALLWIIFYSLFIFRDSSVNGLTNRYLVHYNKYLHKKFFKSKVLEFFWTILPVIVLVYIGYPSLVLLYSLEERINPELIVKVVGHQWYWHYEVEGYNSKLDLCDSYFSSGEEFLDVIRFPLKSFTFCRHYYYFPWLFLYLDDSIFNTDSSFIGNFILLNRGKHGIWSPALDAETIKFVLKDSFNPYSCIFDLNSVETQEEYNSVIVGKSIINTELETEYLNFAEFNDRLYLYFRYHWINDLCNMFSYKYVWIDVDFFGDFVKFNRAGIVLNFEGFNELLLSKDVEFDSYLIKDYDLLYKGEKRMLEVDNRLVLPSRTHIQFLVTAADVIHSFSVPDFGIKIDAIPGRLNQCFIFVKYEGTFFGQCSELCGVDHGYMPIVIDIVSYNYYTTTVRGVQEWEASTFYQSGWDNYLVQ